VVGGGTGGCSVAAKLSYRYGAGNVVVLDAAEVTNELRICYLHCAN
jgi:choline dehydrogenase-like flavoprotein